MTKTFNTVVPYRCPNFCPPAIMAFGTNAGGSSILNFAYCDLPFDLAQGGGELVEPFGLWSL
jgi:hypothetical protein